MRQAISLLICLIILGGCATPSRTSMSAKVLRVHSGDEITIAVDDRVKRVRLAYIDAPDLFQPFGETSRQFLKDHIILEDVMVIFVGNQDSLPTVEVISKPSHSINELMVSTGHAWRARNIPIDSFYTTLQVNARQAQRGLWGLGTPIPPWAWDRVVHGPVLTSDEGHKL